jgi:excisionase family DNA binding protein
MPPLPSEPALLLTVEQAAQALGIGRSLAWKLVARGEIQSLTVGRARRVPRAWLEGYVERAMRKAEEARRAP